jgi:hypothetical protein
MLIDFQNFIDRLNIQSNEEDFWTEVDGSLASFLKIDYQLNLNFLIEVFLPFFAQALKSTPRCSHPGVPLISTCHVSHTQAQILHF